MGKPVYPIERINLAAGTFFADGILALEKIAEYAGLSVDEVKKLQTDKNA